MFWTLAVILLILWLLGFLGGYAGGGLIHILLVIASSWCWSELFRDEDPCSRFDPCRRK
jgi:hypothetical protein